MSLRVLLVAEEAAGAKTLQALARSDHEVVGILTGVPGAGTEPNPVAGAAERLGISTYPAQLVTQSEFIEQMGAWSVDLLLNVHSLYLLPDRVLDVPSLGSFNLHPGPLPEYAGLNTVAWAIYNGDTTYGVTVHWMVPKVDAGPIAFQERFEIGPDETALTLSAQCTRRGVGLLEDLLEAAGRDPPSIPAEPQDLSRRAYYMRRDSPAGGRVDWRRPVDELTRLGRAFDYGPFPCPWGLLQTEIHGRTVGVAGLADAGPNQDAAPGTTRLGASGSLEVACADAWIRVSRVLEADEPIDPASLTDDRTTTPSTPAT